MARPLRIEFPGAVYHVTSRGDRREPIFVDDEDRRALLAVVGLGLSRFDAQALAFCLMGNHYHFVLHTRRANLSLLMRHVNGVYTQAFNRRHCKVGHLFQGRFKAILVDRDAYLVALSRYVERNPVRAGLTADPGHWDWSSYRAHVGQMAAPEWLDTAGLHGYLLGRAAIGAADRREAAALYARWVAEGRNQRLWEEGLRQQVYLGDEAFVDRMQALADPQRAQSREVPTAQRLRMRTPTQWLDEGLAQGLARDQALHRAVTQGGVSMSALAQALGLSVSRVSRLIARDEGVEPGGRPRASDAAHA